MHEDARGNHDTGPTWVPSRAAPRPLAQGDLATIADCLPGDLVVVQSVDGRRVVLAMVGFLWWDGGAHVHLSDPGSWQVNHGAARLARLAPDRVVRILGVRPWTAWHDTDAKRRSA
jgi:hypothetical protein